MKRSIFDEQTSKALKQWHKKAAMKMADGKTEAPHRTRKLGGSPGDSPDHTEASTANHNAWENVDLKESRQHDLLSEP